MIEIQHPTPYYDDSYAVNSENNGPYGDAIMRELVPYIERKYRGIGQGWARFTYGGSTGGWEAMAVQMLDRKSTRLNSSHGYISYAVFCLKKKKITRDSARSIQALN